MSAIGADNNPSLDKTHEQAFINQIRNGYCCVPNLSSGYTARKLINGQFKNDEETVSLDNIAVGIINHKMVAAVVMSNWGGGSGVFKSLLLYEQKDDKALTVGSYCIGDRAGIESLSVSDNKIKLIFQLRDETKLSTALLSTSDFEKAECLQKELPKDIEADAESIIDLYKQAIDGYSKIIRDWKDGRIPYMTKFRFTTKQKETARAILTRHKKDRAHFANILRLKLEAAGWGPGPNPLQFDADGNASLWVEFDHEKYDLY